MAASPVARCVPETGATTADDLLHRRLARRNRKRLEPTLDVLALADTGAELAAEVADRRLEDHFLTRERVAVQPLLRSLPAAGDPEAFLAWFEALRDGGPGQHDPLFPWLAERASMAELRWFLGQEVAGEAGFEDLLALTQLRMPIDAKLEMARNYWDEMGRGQRAGMHGLMLDRLADGLEVRLPVEETVWPSLALANMMVALAWNRRYAYQAVGALGVIELTAPGRAQKVNAALKRLGVAPGDRQYFALHATLDLQHSAAWSRQVLRPLVAADPRRARAIAEGALMRLRAGARCFDRYRAELGLETSRA